MDTRKSTMTISKLSQWEYTDNKGNVNITPRIGVLALLIKQMFPYNFYNRIKIDETQAKQIASVMESMGYEKRKGTEVYANCFITGKYWNSQWQGRLGKQSETLRNKLMK